MKMPSSNTKQTFFPLLALVDFVFFHTLVKWVNITRSFFLTYWSIAQFQLVACRSKVLDGKKNQDLMLVKYQSCTDKKKDYENLSKEDIQMVMGSLGLVCSTEGEKLEEKLSFNELLRLFEEREPSFEEIKEAFDVFDENRDGFIDARELQRVLCILGLREGSTTENCKRMIAKFDENGDGRIDFNEFVKTMEQGFTDI